MIEYMEIHESQFGFTGILGRSTTDAILTPIENPRECQKDKRVTFVELEKNTIGYRGGGGYLEMHGWERDVPEHNYRLD